MTKRQMIVAGNWKMNTNYEEGRELARQVIGKLKPSHVKVILGVPYVHLKGVHHIISGVNNVHLSAQNCHAADGGAFTGEISTRMLQSVGCEYVILGHSERRALFSETDSIIAEKVNKVLDANLTPIFCCGEPLEVREAEKHEELIAEQIKAGLFHLSADDFAKIVVAYEPVWAIGTGVTASPTQAQDMHAFIRQCISKQYGPEIAAACQILYGGSVKPANANELFSQEDVDGGLVGGASLKANDFIAIIEQAK